MKLFSRRFSVVLRPFGQGMHRTSEQDPLRRGLEFGKLFRHYDFESIAFSSLAWEPKQILLWDPALSQGDESAGGFFEIVTV